MNIYSMKSFAVVLTTAATVGLALAGCSTSGSAPASTSGNSAAASSSPSTPVVKSCIELSGMAIPAASIGLPTNGGKVTSAILFPAAGKDAAAVGKYCEVEGEIAPVDPKSPKILFKVALPETWNKKALMFGGGGFNGSVPNVAQNVPAGPANQLTPLGRGYATFASDSGHQATAYGSQDGSSFIHEEAVRNFGGEALKKTRDAAITIIKARYGENPEKSYFAGGSTGGREALTAIKRWPSDWDGAIAWYPAWNNLSAWLAGHKVNLALSKPGAYPNQAKKKLIFDAAMEACDGLDGVTDGLVSNQVKCNAIFDPSTATFKGAPLRCPGGADTGDVCLSDAQITALKALDTDTKFNFFLASGEKQFPGYNMWGSDLGMDHKHPIQKWVKWLAFGTTPPQNPQTQTGPYISLMVDQWIKYMVTRDPDFDSYQLDPENPGAWAGRISQLSTYFNEKSDISAFEARGGKLLLAHGLSDVLVSTRTTEQYYQKLQAQMGYTKVDTFVRFYEVPGYGHALSTVFHASWDSLTALESWVEKGTAPENQVVMDGIGVPGRTRPLCDYPGWPKYNGSGDINLASSFTCATY
ncbi:MAG: tannase/feruloyl esterase family alpha/beta hydrolase [bacterium]